ncbi:MAG: class I SAM-dependent methyltransferase [Limnohabitans sp.]
MTNNINIYWKDFFQNTSTTFDKSSLKQVSKTINGKEISEDQIELIIKKITSTLRLNCSDILADLCCGNGLITKILSHHVSKVIGVDFASGMIKSALTNNKSKNIEYLHSNILNLDRKYITSANKILMFEGLQYFSVDDFSQFMDLVNLLNPGSLVFIGGIPDKYKLREFYDTDEKYEFYLHSEKIGRPHLGKWWSMEEITKISSERNFKIDILQQDSKLYTAYYRFDILLEKK